MPVYTAIFPPGSAKALACLIILDHRHFPLKLLRHLGIFRPFRRLDDAGGTRLTGSISRGSCDCSILGIAFHLMVRLCSQLHVFRHRSHEEW